LIDLQYLQVISASCYNKKLILKWTHKNQPTHSHLTAPICLKRQNSKKSIKTTDYYMLFKNTSPIIKHVICLPSYLQIPTSNNWTHHSKRKRKSRKSPSYSKVSLSDTILSCRQRFCISSYSCNSNRRKKSRHNW